MSDPSLSRLTAAPLILTLPHAPGDTPVALVCVTGLHATLERLHERALALGAEDETVCGERARRLLTRTLGVWLQGELAAGRARERFDELNASSPDFPAELRAIRAGAGRRLAAAITAELSARSTCEQFAERIAGWSDADYLRVTELLLRARADSDEATLTEYAQRLSPQQLSAYLGQLLATLHHAVSESDRAFERAPRPGVRPRGFSLLDAGAPVGGHRMYLQWFAPEQESLQTLHECYLAAAVARGEDRERAAYGLGLYLHAHSREVALAVWDAPERLEDSAELTALAQLLSADDLPGYLQRLTRGLLTAPLQAAAHRN